MAKYKCVAQCFWRERLWSPGETIEEDKEKMPLGKKGEVRHFIEMGKPKKQEKPKPETLEEPIDFDKPLNSMTKAELLTKAKELNMDIDPSIHHFTIKSMIAKRLNG